MRFRPPAVVMTAALCAIVQGCAAVRPAESPVVMRASPTFEASPHPLRQPALSVSPVLGGGAVDQRRYVYVDRTAPGVVRQAASLFWDEPPPKLLERAVVDGLRARLGNVSGPDTPLSAPSRLTVRLDRFEEVEGGGLPAEAKVVFDATLVDQATRSVVLSARYCAAARIGGAEGSDRALAFEAALKLSVLALAGDLERGAASGASGC